MTQNPSRYDFSPSNTSNTSSYSIDSLMGTVKKNTSWFPTICCLQYMQVSFKTQLAFAKKKICCLSLTFSYLNQHIMVKWCKKFWHVPTALLQHRMTMMCLLGSTASWITVFTQHFWDLSDVYSCAFPSPWHTTFIHKVSHVFFPHSY